MNVISANASMYLQVRCFSQFLKFFKLVSFVFPVPKHWGYAF